MRMGNKNSRETENTKVAVPINIMITKEVTERFGTLQRQKEQQKDNKLSDILNSRAKDIAGDNFSTSCGANKLDIKSTEKDLTTTDGKPEEETLLSLSTFELPIPLSKSEADESVQQPITTHPDAKIDETNMDKFANFFGPTNSWKVNYDLENCDDDSQNQHVNLEARYSAFSQHESENKNSECYEEVNETERDSKKRQDFDFIDEEAVIGITDAASVTHSLYNGNRLKEVRVPRVALPVVVDEDEEGRTVIETINAWKIKQRLYEVVHMNDAYWAGELEQLTAKLEDETRTQSDNLERRIKELKTKHTDEIILPKQECKLLLSQVEKCYTKKKNELLKCSELVQKFAQCTTNSGI